MELRLGTEGHTLCTHTTATTTPVLPGEWFLDNMTAGDGPSEGAMKQFTRCSYCEAQAQKRQRARGSLQVVISSALQRGQCSEAGERRGSSRLSASATPGSVGVTILF